MRLDAAREFPKPIAHHIVGDDGIDFDAVHMTRAEHERRHQVAPASRTDDESSKTGGWWLAAGGWIVRATSHKPRATTLL